MIKDKNPAQHPNENEFLNTLDENSFSRGLFLRSLTLGALTVALPKLGLGTKTVRPGLEKWRGFAAPPFSGLPHYYAHDTVLDKYGVIAPWYQQLNGQCDFRLRVSAETMKRYPWTTKENAVAEYPDYLFTSNWAISMDGTITTKHLGDWPNGDMGQRACGVMECTVDYYRYTGDPAAIAHLTYMGDYVLDFGLTPVDHPWPGFPVSVPIKGKPYGKVDPSGIIQIDISASIGEKLLKGYYITKKQRWLDAAKHWGDLIASHCDTTTDGPPWPRYANPETVPWPDHPRMNLQTGSVVMILNFLDELLRYGYIGKNNAIANAREAGVRYLRDKLLPGWLEDKTWGCYYWDWIHDMQEGCVSAWVAIYLLRHQKEFPNWRNDARNILTLFLNRASADPKSGGDVYNGAWAFPESSMCCQRSIGYAPQSLGPAMMMYGVIANDELMRELGYRQIILATYDAHETGVTEDLIDGGVNVNADWLNIALTTPMLGIEQSMAWLPEETGANRENHLVRCSSIVNSIIYEKGKITYTVIDAPVDTISVLRMSFVPARITANGKILNQNAGIGSIGYTIKKLSNGDAIVTIRHDGGTKIIIQGPDPQHVYKNTKFKYAGKWPGEKDEDSYSEILRVTDQKDDAVTIEFSGNQLRLTGRADEWGGLADIYLDGQKQLVHIDCWNPAKRTRQILYYKNGLENKNHTLKIVARGTHNPYSKGSKVYIDSLQFSSATGSHNFPIGTGPVTAQRMILGYPEREDYKDAGGNLWRPCTEIVTPLYKRQDTVAKCWMKRTDNNITNTSDPELYRYGCRARDFWVNVTVGPGIYAARLMFAITMKEVEYMTGTDILINDKIVIKNFNLPGTAKEMNRAVDLVFRDITPVNGIIQIRLKTTHKEIITDAFLQALEINPQITVKGETPVTYK